MLVGVSRIYAVSRSTYYEHYKNIKIPTHFANGIKRRKTQKRIKTIRTWLF